MVKLDAFEVTGRVLKGVRMRNIGFRICERMLASERPEGDVDLNDESVFVPLERFCPDGGDSCVMDNVIGPAEYDVQVIMPVYNTAATVCRAVDSVLNRKGDEKVLLTIINDGSPDNSRELLRRYECRPDVEIIDQDNRGFSGARNAGLRRIRARYVTFLDSDDRLTPGAIHAMMDAARRYDADIVQGGFTLVRPDDTVKRSWIPPHMAADGPVVGFPWGKLYKAQLFERVGFPEKYWYEDTLMSLVIFPMAKVAASVSDVVYEYLVNPTGITSQAHKSHRVMDSFWVTRRLLADREALEAVASSKDYERFLLQVRNNHRRVFKAVGDRMAKWLFEAHRWLRARYFRTESMRRVDERRLRLMDHALESGNYRAFKLLIGLK